MISLNRLSGWQRLWILLAIIWAVPVVAFTIAALPTDTESEIYAQWAIEKIELIRRFHGQNESQTEYRRKVYGNATDREVVRPRADPSKHFDPLTAMPGDELDAINQRYESRLAQLERHSPIGTAIRGFLVWALPAIALYLLGIGVHWVYSGFRSRET
jgi:hypothetical protein